MAQPRVAALLVRDDAADAARAGADWLTARLAEALAVHGRASLALSGGSSPRPMYAELARRGLDWTRIDVYFVDERCVPPDHEKSNYRMAEEALLGPVSAPRVFRMPGERRDREQAAAEYAARLPDRIDVVVLGMGDDGHTASLFPGTDWSQPTGRKVLATEAPVWPRERLTLSPDVLWRARATLVQVVGASKAEAAAIAVEGEPDPRRYPIHIVRGATWLLDRAAAARLKIPGGVHE